jgi:hypothetical protein
MSDEPTPPTPAGAPSAHETDKTPWLAPGEPEVHEPEPRESELREPEPGGFAPRYAPPPRRRELLPVFYIIGFLVLAGALFYLWKQQPGPQSGAGTTQLQNQAQSDRITSLVAQMQALQGEIGQIQASQTMLAQRLEAAASRPPQAGPDLGPLQAQIAALQSRLTAPGPQSQVNQADVEALSKRLDQLTQQQQAQESATGQRLDQLAQQQQTQQSALAQQLTSLSNQLAADDKAAAQIRALADHASHIARLQAAQVALDAGQKLGTIPGAPPALARYAETAPPTAAALRLAFPAAAATAEAASRPDLSNKTFLTRVWARVQDAVTVRQGDNVILGDPASGILARARRSLEAGDLAGTVAVVASLKGPAAQAMAPWLAQAQALLEARAALSAMATGS